MPRKFTNPFTPDELKAKIQNAWKKHPEYGPSKSDYPYYEWRELTTTIGTDLEKVDFNLENLDFTPSVYPANLVGYQTLPNGLTYLGIVAGGDWEYPLLFIIYWDGYKLRGYIPTRGNCFNTDTNSAYGNDEDSDLENVRKRYPGLVTEKTRFVDDVDLPAIDVAAAQADIMERIQPGTRTVRNQKSEV